MKGWFSYWIWCQSDAIVIGSVQKYICKIEHNKLNQCGKKFIQEEFWFPSQIKLLLFCFSLTSVWKRKIQRYFVKSIHTFTLISWLFIHKVHEKKEKSFYFILHKKSRLAHAITYTTTHHAILLLASNTISVRGCTPKRR